MATGPHHPPPMAPQPQPTHIRINNRNVQINNVMGTFNHFTSVCIHVYACMNTIFVAHLFFELLLLIVQKSNFPLLFNVCLFFGIRISGINLSVMLGQSDLLAIYLSWEPLMG